MTISNIYSKIYSLSASQQKEVDNFIDYLQSKKSSKKAKLKERKFGCGKGMFVMKADFDEPLDDFKDYI